MYIFLEGVQGKPKGNGHVGGAPLFGLLVFKGLDMDLSKRRKASQKEAGQCSLFLWRGGRPLTLSASPSQMGGFPLVLLKNRTKTGNPKVVVNQRYGVGSFVASQNPLKSGKK